MKLSIVTINYNDAVGLKRTLDSVAEQTIHCIPYTIHWISEKDKGVYNAMNKGIKSLRQKCRKYVKFGKNAVII